MFVYYSASFDSFLSKGIAKGRNNTNMLRLLKHVRILGGGQNSERRNVERPIFRNYKIANIDMTKDELNDNFIFEFIF